MSKQNILTDNNQTFYAVMVNGKLVSPRYATSALAEDKIKHLSEEHQVIAEVVPVTNNGQQILLG